MLSKLLHVLGDPADVRSIGAAVAGVLVTILGHSTVVIGVVDGVAGLIIAVDTAMTIHGATQKAVAKTTAASKTA